MKGIQLRFPNESVSLVPVAAGTGSGNLSYYIVPSNPKKLIFNYGMDSDEIDIMTPEIGRSLIHYEGLDLIAPWIASMEETSCKE